LLDTLALGLGDYFEKIGAFKTIGVALSGGRDSLLCLFIARRYIDRRFADLDEVGRRKKAGEMLRTFFMPSRFSSDETRRAAAEAAKETGAAFSIIPIDDAIVSEIAASEKMLQAGESMSALAKQNVQARIRSERMWNWSNNASGLFLQ